MLPLNRISVIDSHTGGEPTRIVMGGGPPLHASSMEERLRQFEQGFDHFRSAIVNEPRGSDVVVGGLLCDSEVADFGVIYFNNVGYLGMCVHGTIGLVKTLEHHGKLSNSTVSIETPVGIVNATLASDGRVSVRNVASYRHLAKVELHVQRVGKVIGDVAYGGNWFYLAHEHGQHVDLANVEQLTEAACAVRAELNRQGITGDDGHEVDHIEFFGPPQAPGANGKNFVLCPGAAYDRSPCGTGCSATAACLFLDGKLMPGDLWRQEGIVGSIFDVSVEVIDGLIYPTVTGSAFVTGEATLLLDPEDPLQWGIRK